MNDKTTNEFEDEECSIGNCENTPTHSLYHGEYHYCDKHYVIVGECEGCKTPIHETWDCSPYLCRPCGKHMCECEKCGGFFKDVQGDINDDDEWCCRSCLSEKCASEDPERPCFNDFCIGPDGKSYCCRHLPCECGECEVIGGSCEKVWRQYCEEAAAMRKVDISTFFRPPPPPPPSHIVFTGKRRKRIR